MMTAQGIRPFIGSAHFGESREFYRLLGFEESVIDAGMSYFTVQGRLGFYLQDAYVKDWIENTMLFLEVDDVPAYREELLHMRLSDRFPTVRITDMRYESWGQEFMMLDPAGVLWHFGRFL